jgi:hypothetical protein
MSEHAAQSRSLATSPNVTLSYDSADLIKFYQDLLADINDGKLDQVRKTLVGAMGKIEKEAKAKAEKLPGYLRRKIANTAPVPGLSITSSAVRSSV